MAVDHAWPAKCPGYDEQHGVADVTPAHIRDWEVDEVNSVTGSAPGGLGGVQEAERHVPKIGYPHVEHRAPVLRVDVDHIDACVLERFANHRADECGAHDRRRQRTYDEHL